MTCYTFGPHLMDSLPLSSTEGNCHEAAVGESFFCEGAAASGRRLTRRNRLLSSARFIDLLHSKRSNNHEVADPPPRAGLPPPAYRHPPTATRLPPTACRQPPGRRAFKSIYLQAYLELLLMSSIVVEGTGLKLRYGHHMSTWRLIHESVICKDEAKNGQRIKILCLKRNPSVPECNTVVTR